jgi:hypothetical protein
MLVCENYFTDTGRAIAFQRLEPAFLEDSGSIKIMEIEDITAILPSILFFQKFKHPCPSPDIVPRFAILNLQSNQRLKIPYPWRPDTTEWYQFWQYLRVNPLIISVQGVGETFSMRSLR